MWRTGQALTTRIDARDGVTRIALSGELDMATMRILNDQLKLLEQDGSKAIVVDLRDLGFIDLSGLQSLLRAFRRSETNGHRFLLVGATPIAQRLFEITGTEFLLETQGTAELLDRFTGDGSAMSDQEASAEAHA